MIGRRDRRLMPEDEIAILERNRKVVEHLRTKRPHRVEMRDGRKFKVFRLPDKMPDAGVLS